MKAQRNALVVLVLSAMLVVGLAATAAQAQGGSPVVKSAEAFGIVWTHGNAGGHANPHQSPNLIYHGGPVQTSGTTVLPIFWGTSWGTSAGDKITGLNSFYSNVGRSAYVDTNTEYTDSSGAKVSPAVSFGGDASESSAASSQAPSTTDVLNVVADVYGSNLTAGAYYPVYSDQPRGHTRYCAWHSAGTINGVEVQFGFFFNLDGDAGCDPQSPRNGYSQGAQALVNVSGHELSEMLTDPQLNAWYDSSGEENADKCAWTFGSSLLKIGSTSWKIQGNWSNNAYDHNQGYTDASAGFVRGCIDGTN
jgi:hypothetical protein